MTDGVDWFSRDLTDLVHPIMPGRLYVILAPTGTGKTLFGLNLVAHLWQEYPEIKITVAATEESPRYLDLLACRAAGVLYSDYFYQRLTPPDVRLVATWVQRYRAEPRLAWVPQINPSLSDLLAVLETQSPEVLVIDHLHCLAGHQSLPDFLSTAMTFLPSVATRLNLAVILLAQVHRPQGRDPLYAYRIPTTNAGMGSSKIEQNADVMLGVSRKLKDNLPAETVLRLAKGLLKDGESLRDYEEPNAARVTVLKHRMDDAACRRSLLLTVNGGKLQDRLAVLPPYQIGDSWESQA